MPPLIEEGLSLLIRVEPLSTLCYTVDVTIVIVYICLYSVNECVCSVVWGNCLHLYESKINCKKCNYHLEIFEKML